MILDQINYESILCQVQNHTLVRVFGRDAESFLQGQITNDIHQLREGRAQLSCRLTLKGKIQSFFSLGRFNSALYLFIATDWASSLIHELERYVIMEDIQFEKISEGDFIVRTGALAMFQYAGEIPVHYLGFQGYIENFSSKEKTYSTKDLEEIIIYSGFPVWKKSIEESDFINETILDWHGISYKKGCFFGQEMPAKINSGRGGNYFPCLFQVDKKNNLAAESEIWGEMFFEGQKAGRVIGSLHSKNILYCKIKRAYRALGQELLFETSYGSLKGQFIKFPAIGWMDDQQLSQHLFLRATEIYHKENGSHHAISLLKKAIRLDDKNADAYEALGVILGHQEKYDEAISLMKKLSEVNPSSIMSHTNLSLFYMKKGEIKQAEEEKAKATVLGMKLAGKKKREDKEQEQADVRREQMYREVLVIDPKDALAHYGLANLYFERGEVEKSLEHVGQAIESNPKYSQAYLLFGQALEGQGQWERAQNIYQKGQQIATNQGDTKIANEIQERIKKASPRVE